VYCIVLYYIVFLVDEEEKCIGSNGKCFCQKTLENRLFIRLFVSEAQYSMYSRYCPVVLKEKREFNSTSRSIQYSTVLMADGQLWDLGQRMMKKAPIIADDESSSPFSLIYYTHMISHEDQRAPVLNYALISCVA
jgi:hypothetical protein